MKVSLNTVKQFIDFELPPVDELVRRINEQLGGVEEVIDLGAKYKDAVIVKVVEAEKHPNADRLNVTKIDDGGVVKDVPRDGNGLVQVVCGAPNVHADMFAVWLPPKSTVPASFEDAEPFVLDARELRGVFSQGMLAAADELAIGSDHEGIIEINPDEWKPSDADIKPGVSFAKVYGLDDTVIDIENKMFTHRPDLFGQIGVAREIAGILGHKFTSPSWYTDKLPQNTPAKDSILKLEVFNDAGDKVPRIMFVALQHVAIKPSPLWLQCALVAMGSKPINNVVDVTNYVMLLTAQPTHAYDYAKIRGSRIGARMAKPGEKLKLLNGKTYELSEDDIVIADGEGPIGLGGIMGGGDSEVDEHTTDIVLEVATFDMYAARKSSMRHGVFTDALTRFNKGQSSLQNDHIMNLLITSMKDVTPAEQASEVFDLGNYDDCIDVDGIHGTDSLGVTSQFVNERLGLALSNEAQSQLLENVEMKVAIDPDGLEIFVPFWRTDIELPEDIVEEIGRLYGFDKLPRELPLRAMKSTAKNDTIAAKQRARDSLSRAGGNEVLTYSFVHENIIKKAGQDLSKAYRLGNALSPDLQYYRLSIVPSLLDKVHMNIKAGYDEFLLFEIGKAHHKDERDDEGLPREFQRIGGVYAAKAQAAGAAYYQAARFVARLADEFGVLASTIRYQPLSSFAFEEHDMFRQLAQPFAPERAAVVWIGDRLCGVVGEFRPSVQQAFKLPARAAGFELFISWLAASVTQQRPYVPLSRYPSTSKDISLQTAADISYETLYNIVVRAGNDELNGVRAVVTPQSVYQPDRDTTHKTTTFHLVFTSDERTLTDGDTTPILDTIVQTAAKEVDAILV